MFYHAPWMFFQAKSKSGSNLTDLIGERIFVQRLTFWKQFDNFELLWHRLSRLIVQNEHLPFRNNSAIILQPTLSKFITSFWMYSSSISGSSADFNNEGFEEYLIFVVPKTIRQNVHTIFSAVLENGHRPVIFFLCWNRWFRMRIKLNFA